MKSFLRVTIFAVLLIAPSAYALSVSAPTLSVLPEHILQGDPVLVEVVGATSTEISSITFLGVSAPIFTNNGKPSALFGTELSKPVGGDQNTPHLQHHPKN